MIWSVEHAREKHTERSGISLLSINYFNLGLAETCRRNECLPFRQWTTLSDHLLVHILSISSDISDASAGGRRSCTSVAHPSI